MKVKSLMLLLALAGLGAGCSDDEATGGNTGGNTTGRPELQIVLSGTGESQSYDTRAIATESENKIEALQIYLFASDSENGTYHYLETWNAGTTAFNPDDVDAGTGKPKTQFKITDAGTSKKATLYPNELAGLPYIKLYCIANQNVKGVLASDGATETQTTDENFYKEDGTTKVTALTAVTSVPDGNGGYTITPGTTETDFCSIFTKALGTTDVADGVISTPLVMTGSGKTKISGSVSKVNIDLRRIVARFDIDNTTSKSNLTIKKVQIAQGRKTAMLWDAKTTKATLTPVVKANLGTDPLILQKSVAIDFDKLEGANEGVTKSSIYVYPTLATDESYLILDGTYKSPTTSKQVEVTYHVPIARTPENAEKGQPIAIEANNRYCLRITDVTQSNVFGTFEVVDWTSAGGITIRPDNDAPVFDSENPAIFGGKNKPKNLNDGNSEATTFDYEVTGDTDGAGSFSVQIAATGKVRYETEVATTTKAETDWLTIQTGATEERDGVYYTTFEFSYTNSIGQQPVAVHFINEAASYDPALWTTVNFYGPKAVPSFADVTDGVSFGNKTDVTNPKAPTATLYAVDNSFVLFDITSIEGVKVEEPVMEGYKVEEVASKGFVHTYKIYVSDQSKAKDGKIVFLNAGDETKTTTLTITKADPSLAFEEVAKHDAVTYAAGTETPFITTGKLNIDLDALTSGYSFKVKAPVGLTPAAFTSTWLDITVDNGTWSEGTPYLQYTLKAKAGATTFDDFTMVFTNAIKGTDITGPGLTLTVHKDYEKPKFSAGTTTDQWSKFNVGLASDFSKNNESTISMYKTEGSAITVNMNCNEAASFETATGLTVTKVSGNEYKISIANASDLASITDKTTVVKAHNDGAYANDPSTDRTATLTITWVDPAITVEAVENGGGSEIPTVTNLSVQVTKGFTKFNSAMFNIKGHKGSTIKYSDTTGKWATFADSPAEIGDNGLAEVSILGSADTGDTSTLTITVHNAVTDQDEEITVSKATL